MPTPRELLIHLDPIRFAELVTASPKKFREELFRAAGIRVKSEAFSLKSEKNEVRVQRLYAALQEGVEIKEEVLEEMIRNYLCTRRSLLSDALEYWKVPHDNGLTDNDLSFLSSLKPEETTQLRVQLHAKHDPRDVDLYFAFMNIPNESGR